MNFKLFVILIFNYLIGCFNVGYYYIKFKFKKDIRSIGSLSTGATNVSRISGKKGFIITFLGDSFKAIISMIFFKSLGLNTIELELCLLAVILGHIFPIQLGFKGGKGVSPFLSGLIIFNYNLILLLILNFIILFIFIRDYKICGLISFIFLLIEYILNSSMLNSLIFFIIVSILLFAHRENLKIH